MSKGFKDQVREGMDVFDVEDQKVGTVAEIAEGYLRVPFGFLGMGEERHIPFSVIDSVDGQAIYLSLAKDRLDGTEADDDYDDTTVERTTTTAASGIAAAPGAGLDEEQMLQLREEELSARKHAVETGHVQLGKEVVSEQRTIEVPVTREEVAIERRAVDHRPSDTPIRDTDQTISVPVREEQVTAEKQAVIYEEVKVGKRAVQETEHVSETVRREKAVVDTQGAVDIEDDKLP
jgi:uncharacterized protein (TIGR02271 family)